MWSWEVTFSLSTTECVDKILSKSRGTDTSLFFKFKELNLYIPSVVMVETPLHDEGVELGLTFEKTRGLNPIFGIHFPHVNYKGDLFLWGSSIREVLSIN